MADPRPPEYHDTMRRIRAKFSAASDFEEDIEVHMDEFEMFEKRLKMENKEIFLRAITTPPDDDGTGIHLGRTFYHWGFYTINNGKKDAQFFSYHPPAPTTKPRQSIIFTRTFMERKELTYKDYLEVRMNANPDYRANKNYFVPEPDPVRNEEDDRNAKAALRNQKIILKRNPSMLEQIEKDCVLYINDRLEEYLEEFKESRGNYYHLFRGDFYRKLKVEHLSLDHKLLISAAVKNWIDCHFLEGELREAYADAIESLV